jgi:hypothetical protein
MARSHRDRSCWPHYPQEHVANPWHGDFRCCLGQVRFQPRRRLVLNPATPFEPRSKIARIGIADARCLALMTESSKLDRFRHASFLPVRKKVSKFCSIGLIFNISIPTVGKSMQD